MGPAGVGKTTLALRYLELARKQGMAVARASATRASQALPFGALAAVLPPDPDGRNVYFVGEFVEREEWEKPKTKKK